MACLRARVGDAEAALRNLDIYVHAFILRNGFHANGDQTGSGFSSFTYRPFTLEGNFLAMEAVHEMLLQSWSAHPGTARPGRYPPVPRDCRGAGTALPLKTCAPKAATAFPPAARTTPPSGSKSSRGATA